MTIGKKKKVGQPSEREIDLEVEAAAGNPGSWEKPVRARRGKLASLSIPADLAARAAFLARLHREKHVDEWLARIIRERVEIEEDAFAEAKRTVVAHGTS
ncbi:MAG: hypothetical protein L0312_19310 [Acidobacteria bacterium]|nr:hypothetical protein [Acidobacteriota bacterium]MCI0724673.1 hypothetical protein [Acidobacteriota bacterium]